MWNLQARLYFSPTVFSCQGETQGQRTIGFYPGGILQGVYSEGWQHKGMILMIDLESIKWEFGERLKDIKKGLVKWLFNYRNFFLF